MLRKMIIISITCFLITLPNITRADDTDIFGGGLVNVPPNVLIIFDNSGSMGDNVTVPGSTDPYVSTTQYTGSYNRRRVYYQSWGSWWSEFVSIGSNEVVDASEIPCDSARTALNTLGHWQGQISSSSYSCSGGWLQSQNLRTGNYLNFLATQSPHTRKKIDVAKDTIKELIDTTEGVRFGLMIFNEDEGGHIVAGCQDRNTTADKTELKTIIDGLSASTWTPLAETLAEAGLYFARQPSWFNSGVNYATPTSTTTWGHEHAIQWRCQKNYIIIMTDGASTQDKNTILTTTNYMYNKSIGDYDHDVPSKHSSELKDMAGNTYDSSGSDYLDDVAKFLNENDLLPTSVTDSSGTLSYDNVDFPKQNIVTYTIGFATDQDLLTRTADSTHGQGRYFTTSGSVSLTDVFEQIIGNILAVNSQFVSPVVPVNRVNRTYADNGLYLGIFAPDNASPGLWKGNIKKFGFDKDGNILDRDGNPATTDGAINEGAYSAWVNVGTGTEGMQVDKGGAGASMMNSTYQPSRTFKTFKPGTGTGTGNITFNTSNIQFSDLALLDSTASDDLINFVTASGIYAPTYSSSGGKPRSWILGDIIHSQPAVLYDRPLSKNVIFVGANDGFLHCLVDSDQGTSNNLTDDRVLEAWAFIPWDILPNLKYLPSTNSTSSIAGDTTHDYFVDGSPVVYKTGNNNYLAFGLRRGGKNFSAGGELTNQYFILNISDYTSPTQTASIAKTILGTENLGQSWATPYFCKIKQTGGSTTADVLMLTGGYDTNQDIADPGLTDSKGRAIFAVNAASGTLANTNLNFNYSNYNKMKYCMVDFKSYDDDSDDCDDVVYAPSVGGDLFVFESKKHTTGTAYDGVWSHRLLFHAVKQDSGSTNTQLRKFFYAPGIAQETWGDFVYIGSGNRENPSEAAVTNRLYAIRNTWPQTWDDDSPITDSNLTNVTDDITQGTISSPSSMTDAQKAAYNNGLDIGFRLVFQP